MIMVELESQEMLDSGIIEPSASQGQHQWC